MIPEELENLNNQIFVEEMRKLSEKLKSLSFEVRGSLEKAKKSLSFLSIFRE